MTTTATLVDDREDDRLYRVTSGAEPRWLLVSRYGSRMYGNAKTCVRELESGEEPDGPIVATFHGVYAHDEALGMLGIEVSK